MELIIEVTYEYFLECNKFVRQKMATLDQYVIANGVVYVEPKKGKWIEVEPHQSDLEEGIDYREECSICHEPNRHYVDLNSVRYYKTKYCPNCGARMSEAKNGTIGKEESKRE